MSNRVLFRRRHVANIRDGRTAARGFSLLEVLVAFTLMALVLAVLLRVFSGGLQGLGLADDYARAASIAQSALARVGADIALAEGTHSGETAERYRWTVSVRPYQSQQDASQPVQPSPVVLHEVDVSVAWSEYGRDRRVVLSTLRAGPRS